MNTTDPQLLAFSRDMYSLPPPPPPDTQADSMAGEAFRVQPPPKKTIAAQRVFGTNELLENILIHIDDQRLVVRLSALTKTAHDIVHNSNGMQLRWVTFLQPVTTRNPPTWLVSKAYQPLPPRIVPSDYVIDLNDKKQKRAELILRRPIILNQLICTDKHYRTKPLACRLTERTEVLSLSDGIEALIDTPALIPHFSNMIYSMQICQPPTKILLLDWMETMRTPGSYTRIDADGNEKLGWDTGGYKTSGTRNVRRDRGVTVRDVVMQMLQVKHMGNYRVTDVRIPDGLFVTAEEWEDVGRRQGELLLKELEEGEIDEENDADDEDE